MNPRISTAVMVLALMAGARSALADDAPSKDAPHARVSFVEGDFFVRGPFDAEEQNLTLNSIIREGDILRSADNTLGEIELPGENFVRLAANSVVRVDRIAGALEVTVIEGAAYVSHGRMGEAVANTKVGGIGLADSTMARVEASRVDSTMVLRIASGAVEATCQDNTVKLDRGNTLTCGEGLAQRGQWDPKAGDSFDRWNLEREDHVRHYSSAPPEVAGRYEGLQDLEGNGTWVYVDNGWYWQPTVVVTDWRPYYDGYWNWYGGWGWTWVPYTPWGYVTHHYGRWIHRGGYGWMWSPAPVWAGAWVVWGSFGGYVGWSPCDFWGRPIIATARYTYYDPAVWSFGHARYFYQGGGNYLHAGYAVRNPDVVNAVTGAGHARPVFTMNHEQISQIRATPVRDPHIALAPMIAGERPSITHAASRNSIISNIQPVATRPGPLLSRMVEHEHTVAAGAGSLERVQEPRHSVGGNGPGGASPEAGPDPGRKYGAGQDVRREPSNNNGTLVQPSHQQLGHEPNQAVFSRPSFTRQQPADTTRNRFDAFNRWSSSRARSQSEHEIEVSPERHDVGVGTGNREGTIVSPTHQGESHGLGSNIQRSEPVITHQQQQPVITHQHEPVIMHQQPMTHQQPVTHQQPMTHQQPVITHSQPVITHSQPVSRPSSGGGRRR
jgi:hypothetical protein